MEIHHRVEALCRECGYSFCLFEVRELLPLVCTQCGGEMEILKAEPILLA